MSDYTDKKGCACRYCGEPVGQGDFTSVPCCLECIPPPTRKSDGNYQRGITHSGKGDTRMEKGYKLMLPGTQSRYYTA